MNLFLNHLFIEINKFSKNPVLLNDESKIFKYIRQLESCALISRDTIRKSYQGKKYISGKLSIISNMCSQTVKETRDQDNQFSQIKSSLNKIYNEIANNINTLLKIINEDLRPSLTLFKRISFIDETAKKKLQESESLYPKLMKICIELNDNLIELNSITTWEFIEQKIVVFRKTIDHWLYAEGLELDIKHIKNNYYTINTNLYIPATSQGAETSVKELTLRYNHHDIANLLRPFFSLHDEPSQNSKEFKVAKDLQHLIDKDKYPAKMDTDTTEVNAAEGMQNLKLKDNSPENSKILQKTEATASFSSNPHKQSDLPYFS